MKVTLKKVFTNIKTTKFGEKLSVGLKIEENEVQDINGDTIQVNDRYINCWLPKESTFPYSEGDVVNILVKQRGDFLDFKLADSPQYKPGVKQDNSDLERRVKALEDKVFAEEVSDPDDF